jgi:hypothetical protein
MSASVFLRFEMLPRPADRKTDTWRVLPALGENDLGTVKFHGAWRKYCFFPVHETLYDPGCLRAIADFCEQATITWRRE